MLTRNISVHNFRNILQKCIGDQIVVSGVWCKLFLIFAFRALTLYVCHQEGPHASKDLHYKSPKSFLE